MMPKWPGITWASSNDTSEDAPRVLGINPWIFDFAAFNLWSRPAGLLAVLDMLRAAGTHVALLDCLDQTWSDAPWPRPHATGKGHYPKHLAAKPSVLRDVPRRFSRYGQDPELVRVALAALNPPPDLILITSIMTYWYPGAREAIAMARDIWPKTPVVLGGIYASLCPDHAAGLDADLVLGGKFEDPANWSRLWKLLGQTTPAVPANAGMHLALDLYADPAFSIVLGSRGCPFRCPYCASHSLHPTFRQAPAPELLVGIRREYARGVRDFAFYDDALLVQPETWLWPLLEWFTGKNARLHTPNAMHIRYLTPEVCARLKRAGFSTIRLGLETVDFAHRLDAKLSREQWEAGLAALRGAGFGPDRVGAYILFGLPDQDMGEVERTIRLVRASGIKPDLAFFTPIPTSPLFERAREVSMFPVDTEPLCQNNSIWPCVPGGFSWDAAMYWRKVVGG